MRKILTILLGTCIILISSFISKNEKSSRFKIIGATVGFPDSTLIFLNDLSDGSYKDIDSTIIFNGKFIFAGTFPQSITKVAIRTKDFSDRSTFWIENSTISFTAEKGKFKDAIINGSQTQIKKYELDSALKVSTNKKHTYILFIQKNPTSIISADLLNVYSSTWNKDTVSILYTKLSPEIKNTIYGKNVFEFLSLNKNLKIGDKYVDFSQPNLFGENVKLSDFHGKIILLEFWGSWCVPCRQGHPELVKTYDEFKDSGFEILGVAADNKTEHWIDAVRKDSLTWQNVSDLNGDRNKAALIYGVSYYPANFLIDRNGTIIAKDLRGEKLREKLKELLH